MNGLIKIDKDIISAHSPLVRGGNDTKSYHFHECPSRQEN